MKCIRCIKEAKTFPRKDGICEECSNEIYLGQEPIQIERLEQEMDV